MKIRDIVKDLPYWKDVKQGKIYQTRAMYKAIRGEKEKVSWNKVMLQNLARPRSIFTLWMTLNGKLQTKDRLIKFGMQMDPKCTFVTNLKA